jgi:hypothetical protein
MTSHDTSEYDAKKLLTELNAVKRISPEFSDLSMDIQDVLKESSNPSFLAALLYKLVKEREETNRILKSLEIKFEKIQETLTKSPNSHTKLEIAVLSEPDQHIMQMVTEQGMVSAQEVQARLSYKGTNAASQRLNKLAREGHLKKIRSGKKVLFTR